MAFGERPYWDMSNHEVSVGAEDININLVRKWCKYSPDKLTCRSWRPSMRLSGCQRRWTVPQPCISLCCSAGCRIAPRGRASATLSACWTSCCEAQSPWRPLQTLTHGKIYSHYKAGNAYLALTYLMYTIQKKPEVYNSLRVVEICRSFTYTHHNVRCTYIHIQMWTRIQI